jgi:hypothetical protein
MRTMGQKVLKGHLRNLDGSGSLGLGRGTLLDAVVADSDRPFDAHRASIEVDIPPAQRQGLAAPASLLGSQPQVGQELRVVLLSRQEDPSRLLVVGATRSLPPTNSGGGTFMTGLLSAYSIETANDMTADRTVRTLRTVAGEMPFSSARCRRNAATKRGRISATFLSPRTGRMWLSRLSR